MCIRDSNPSVKDLHQQLESSDRLPADGAMFIAAYRMYGEAGSPLGEVDPQGPTIAGMFVPDTSPYSVRAVSDLIDKTVHVPLPHPSDSKDNDELACQHDVLESPFRSGGSAAVLDDMFDTLTVSNSRRMVGRININNAKREAVASVPGINDTMVDAIMAARSQAGSNRGLGFYITGQHLSVKDFRSIEPYVTCCGHVFSATSIGHSQSTPVRLGTTAFIDASSTTPGIVGWKQFRPTVQLVGRAKMNSAIDQQPGNIQRHALVEETK